MKQIFVNKIIEDKGSTVGLAVLNKTVLDNLKTIYPNDTPARNKLDAAMFIASKSPLGVYFFDRF